MRIFGLLLHLYPLEYRAVFAPEMLSILEKTAREKSRLGPQEHICFLCKESVGLLKGAAIEWIAKFTGKGKAIDRPLPDPSGYDASLPAEVLDAQRFVQQTLKQMEYAIAHHQFEKARFYSYAESKAREKLRLLQQKHNIAG